jgi:hypothetical protein
MWTKDWQTCAAVTGIAMRSRLLYLSRRDKDNLSLMRDVSQRTSRWGRCTPGNTILEIAHSSLAHPSQIFATCLWRVMYSVSKRAHREQGLQDISGR